MFCIRNTTIVLVIILGALIAYIIYSKYGNNSGNNGNNGGMPSMQRTHSYSPFYTMPIPDVLENPYVPPLRDF